MSRVNDDHDKAFREGILKYGREFIIRLEEYCFHRYEFSKDESIVLKKVFDAIKRNLATNRLNLQSNEPVIPIVKHCKHVSVELRLRDLVEFGIDKCPLLLSILGDASKRLLASRVSYPASSVSDESRRESMARTVSTGSEDVDDYADDDFEDDEDVASESHEDWPPDITSMKSNRKYGLYEQKGHADIDDDDYISDHVPSLSPLNQDEEETQNIDDEDEIKLMPSKSNFSGMVTKPSPIPSPPEYIMPKPSSIEPIETRRRFDSVPSSENIIYSSKAAAQSAPVSRKASAAYSTAPPIQNAISPNVSSTRLINRDIVSTEVKSSKSSKSNHSARKSRVDNWIRERKWALGDKIGFGSFGEVFQGMNKETGKLFACKALPITNNIENADKLADEIDLMRGLSHPNIVEYIGTLVDEDKSMVYIFQEWVPGGSVAHLLKKFGPFDEHVVRNYTRQILHGLQYLHDNNIVHRDIKGGNVLVDDAGTVKLADFGASRKFDLDGTQATSTIRGTPYFMAPEVLAENRYGRKGDIWALGCTMIQMLTGHPPWKEYNLTNLVQLHILLASWNKGPPPYQTESPLTEECEDCLRLCFDKNEPTRPTAHELLKCSFLITSEEDLIDGYEQSDSDQDQINTSDISKQCSNGGIINKSEDMEGIRVQLGRAVSRASIALGDDTLGRVDREIELKQQRDQSKQRSDMVTPPRQPNRQLLPPKIVSSPDHNNNQIPRSDANLPQGLRPGAFPEEAQVSGGSPPSMNPYAKGATRISREIVAKAAANKASPPTGKKFSPATAVSQASDGDYDNRPSIDTSHRNSSQKAIQLIRPVHQTRHDSSNDSKHSEHRSIYNNGQPNATRNSSQSSARDSEALTPFDEEGSDGDADSKPSHAVGNARDAKVTVARPAPSESSQITAPTKSKEFSSSKPKTASAAAIDQSKPPLISRYNQHVRVSRTSMSNRPTAAANPSLLREQPSTRKRGDNHEDQEAEDKIEQRWVCLKCKTVNALPENEEYCGKCATVRGATGIRDVRATLTRR